MAAIDHGPAHLPENLYSGTRARVLLGMKVHANTISHARLVALEDTFPRTRAYLGDERFNALSRQFLESPGATARQLALIGAGFPAFLQAHGEPEGVAELAAFEWAWLTSFHAADAEALKLGDLAGLGESALLDVLVARHPAANIGLIGSSLRRHLAGDVPGLEHAEALLLVRPVADVLAFPATSDMWWTLAPLERPTTIGNLFAAASEPGCNSALSPDDFMAALLGLIEAGALQRVG